jgi:hypothetical protein
MSEQGFPALDRRGIVADSNKFEEELHRLLATGSDRQPVKVELAAPHTSTWPWQVPQVPTITSDRTPDGN